jgi:hypothetical protein
MMLIVNYYRYTALDACRRFARWLKRNTGLAVLSCIGIALSLFGLTDLVLSQREGFGTIFPYVVLAYALFKIIQRSPSVTLPYNVFSFRLFDLRTFKIFLLLRMVVPTLICLLVLVLLGVQPTPALLAALLGNLAANAYSVLKPQLPTLRALAYAITSIALIVAAVLLSQPILALVPALGLNAILLARKNFKYDDVLPFFEQLLLLRQALTQQNQAAITTRMQPFLQKQKKTLFALTPKNYGPFIGQRLELARILDHTRGLLACLLVVFGFAIAQGLYLPEPIFRGAVVAAALFITNVLFLRFLNENDKGTARENPVLQRTFKAALADKYGPHALINVIALLCAAPCISLLMLPVLVVDIAALPLLGLLSMRAKRPIYDTLISILQSLIITPVLLVAIV